MRKMVLAFTVFLLLFAIAIPVGANNTSSNRLYCDEMLGDGSKENPFVICRHQQLPFMEHQPNAYFVMDRSFDMLGGIFPSIPYFNGSFNGNGYTITGFRQQLFETLGPDATVENLRINVEVADLDDSGIVAHTNYGTIDQLYVRGEVNGTSTLGGIVANNEGTISNSRVNINLGGHNNIGGIAANNMGTIRNSQMTGNLDGHDNIGGIAANNQGTIANSQVNINLDGNVNIGGIAAVNGESGKILNTESQININGSHRVGSIAGINNGKIIESSAAGIIRAHNGEAGGIAAVNGESGKIISSDSEVNISGSHRVGGIAGINHGQITEASASNSIHTHNGETGGIVGVNASDGKVLNARSYVNINYQNGSNVGQIAGVNDGKIRGSFGFGNLHGNDQPTNIFYLYTTNDLERLHDYPDAHFKLAADISFGDWRTPVKQFSGTLDGQNYTLYNLNNQMFDSITAQGVVKHLNLANVDINQPYHSPTRAIVVAQNHGTIDDVHIQSGGIFVRSGAHGIAGSNYGTIRNSSAAIHVGSITGTSGIAGSNSGQIINVEFSGSVTGDFYAAGITNHNAGLIDNAVANSQIRIYMGYGGGLVSINEPAGEIRNSVAHSTIYYFTSPNQTAIPDPLVVINDGVIVNSQGYGNSYPFSY